MTKEKETQQTDELGKTRVMSLSTLSKEVVKIDNELQDSEPKEKEVTKKAEIESPKIETEQDESSMIQEEIETIEEKDEIKQDTSISKEVEESKETKEDIDDSQTEDVMELESEEQVEEELIDSKKAESEISEIQPKKEHDIEDHDKEELDKEEVSSSKNDEDMNASKPVEESSNNDEDSSIEEQAKKQEKLTLEEKRRNERSNLMTIEEKRALQKEGKLPVVTNEKKKFSDGMGKVDYALLIVSMLMGWFVTYRIYSYFSWGYALLCFFIIHIILAGTFFLSKKKRKIGLGINIVVSILLLILSLLVFKVNDFTDQIFDNSESEMIMLVAKKDSTITEKDDFKDKKIAFIKSDGDTNTFAKEMLTEAKKESYEENVFVTYKEAYEALMSNDVDMMIYTSFTKQRLAEDDIQSWDEIKVVMQKSRALKAVESKKVDISKDPFNIYISGVDLTSYSINEKGSSDVNIIMTVNPQTEKIIMQTIPRDTWAGLTCSNGDHTKLTYAGAYGGIDCSIKTIEELIGIDINYYAKINFQGVIDLVDALGGITVNSNVSFCEAHSVEGYGLQNYCYNAGINTLDGVNALMFARIRKVFSDGDVERGRHQMEVVNAVIRKFSESPSLGNINALLGAVEDNFTTNLEEDDIGKGLELFLGLGDSLKNIETITMEGELVWKTDEVSNEYLYYFIPNDGQVDLVKQRIQDVMDGK